MAHCSEVEVATLPDTVSLRLGFPDEACHTEVFHDARSAHHDRRIANAPSHENRILFDVRSAAHSCPADDAPQYPVLPGGRGAPKKLRSATGMRKAAACF